MWCARFTSALLALAVSASLAGASPPTRAPSGGFGLPAISPTTELAGERAAPTASLGVPDGAGGVIVVWSDDRNGSWYAPDVYAQRLAANGAPQWTPNGIAVCTAAEEQRDAVAVSDGAGGVIVAWTDSRGVEYDVYAQRLNDSGVPQWTADGVAVCTAMGQQMLPRVVSDGAGGAIVGWTDARTGNFQIYAQRVSAAGLPVWTADGVPVCSVPGYREVMVTEDGAGGAIFAWVDDRVSSNQWDVYAQRLDAVGAPQWTVNGVAVCVETGAQFDVTMATDGAGGAYLAWVDLRAGGEDVYAQRVDGSGTPVWTAGGVPIATWVMPEYAPEIVADGAGGALLAWRDSRGADTDIYVQWLDGLGAPRWTPGGIAACAMPGDQDAPMLVPDGAGGIIVAWFDYAFDGDDFRMQRLNSAGMSRWGDDGVMPCPPRQGGGHFALVAVGPGSAVVTWLDFRSSLDEDIYAQRVDSLGTEVWTAGGVPVFVNPGYQRHPASAAAGGGSVVVAWSAKQGGSYDVFAQKVDALGAPLWPVVAVSAAAGSQVFPTVVPDGSGGAIAVWTDHRAGIEQIYAQRVNGSSFTLWPTDGVLVSSTSNAATPTAIPDGSGGVIVAWTDTRDSKYHIYAQRLASNGSPQWTAGGVAVGPGTLYQWWPRLTGDGSGGAIVAWIQNDGGTNDVWAQRVGAGGALLWTAVGIPVCTVTGDQGPVAIAPDGAGGAIVVWEDRRYGADIYGQRLDSAGARQWAANGAPVCTLLTDHQYEPAATSDGAGGAIVAWEDSRGSDTGNIHAQRVNAAGAQLWAPDGVAVCAAARPQSECVVTSDGVGGAFVAWRDERVGGDYCDLYAQRLDGTGTALWTLDGVGVGTAPYDQEAPALASDGTAGCFVFWQDHRAGDRDLLYAQRLGPTGAALWGTDGVTATLVLLAAVDAQADRVRIEWRMSVAGGSQAVTVQRRTEASDWEPVGAIAADPEGRLLFEDREVRAGTRYGYRLVIVEDGAERWLGESWVTVPGRLALALGAPASQPAGGEWTVEFTLPVDGRASLELFDLAGRRLVRREVGDLGPGVHVTTLPGGAPARSGVYLLRLTQAGRAVTRKASFMR